MKKAEVFGRALGQVMSSRGITQVQLAEMIGMTQSAVSGWTRGKAEPAASTVFALERLLGVSPGFLSRYLGYLPIEAVSAVPTIEDAIQHSSALDDDFKRMLLAVYRELIRYSQGPRGSSKSRSRKSSARKSSAS